MEPGGASSGSRRKTGRPLSFDRDAALEQAMLTFWRHGYESTSIVDLTTAMGITAPSLYGRRPARNRRHPPANSGPIARQDRARHRRWSPTILDGCRRSRRHGHGRHPRYVGIGSRRHGSGSAAGHRGAHAASVADPMSRHDRALVAIPTRVPRPGAISVEAVPCRTVIRSGSPQAASPLRD